MNLDTIKAKYSPTSLADLLWMYSKAEDLCYVDFMAGAKALVTFMAPIEIPVISSKLRLPDLLGGYVASELAKIIALSNLKLDLTSGDELGTMLKDANKTDKYLKDCRRVELAICWVMMQDVFPKLQAQWETQEMDSYSGSLGMGTGSNYE